MELPARFLCLLLQASLIVWTGWCQEQCGVQVSSTMEYVPFGSSALLNCTYNCSTPSWESRLQTMNQKTGDNWVSIEVLVDDWERSIIHCIQTLDNGETQKSSVTVGAYELPSNVLIDLEEELEEGQRQTVTCTVFSVAPISNLKISVMRGGREIASSTFEEDTRSGLQTLSETFDFEANRRDNLQDFYCRAILELGTVQDNMVQSESISVQTYAPPEFPSIFVVPSTTIYEYEPLNLTCQSEGFPEPEFFWTTPSGADVIFSPDKSQVIIAEATAAHNGAYECEARNLYGRVRQFKMINVMALPTASPEVPLILVTPDTTVKEGGSLNLICQSNGHPNPEYTWRVPSKALVDYSEDKSEVVITKVTSAHDGTYTCHARNKYGESKQEQIITVIGNGVFSTRPTDILLVASLLAFILFF